MTKARSMKTGYPKTGIRRMMGRIKNAGIVSAGLVLIFLTAAYAQAQNASPNQKQDNVQGDSLFAGTEKFSKGAIKSTEVNLDKNMLAMAGKSFGPGGQGATAALAAGLDAVLVRDYEYAKPGQYKMADVQKYLDRLNGGGWFHMVRERSATENTDVCFRGGDDGEPSEMVVIAAQPDQLTFVYLKGRLSMSDLSKLSHNFGSPQLKTRSH